MRILLATYLLFAALPAAGHVYDVKDYGAVSDTTRLSTAAIQRAIDSCAAGGGGTVRVPAGDYLCTTVSLKSNVTLHLDAGATIYASRKVSDYKDLRRSVGATDNDFVEVLIGAADADNIAVTGRGRLHCRAEREGYVREPQRGVADSVTGREIANAIRYGADYRSKFRKVPPCPGAINFTGCTNVLIRDIQVIESSFWSVHLQWCDRVNVDGIYIGSDPRNGVNADGLDIDGCSRVTVGNCVIDTGDDALCLKTTDHNGKSRPCRDITIQNCVLTSSSAALKFGTESHNDFENIAVSNCVISQANRGICMIIRDGGTVRNATFSNMVINTVRKDTFWWGNGDPLWFTIQKRDNAASAGAIENVSLQNITARGQSGVRLEGFSNRLRNIRFSDFRLAVEPEAAVDKRARDGFLIEGADGITLVNCSVNWEGSQEEWESAYHFKHIDGLELTGVKGEKAPNGNFEAFRFHNVRNVTTDRKINYIKNNEK